MKFIFDVTAPTNIKVKNTDEIKKLKSERDSLRNEADNATRIIADKEVHIDNLIRRLHELEHLLVDANTRAKKLSSDVAEKDTQLGRLHNVIDQDKKKIDTLVSDLEKEKLEAGRLKEEFTNLEERCREFGELNEHFRSETKASERRLNEMNAKYKKLHIDFDGSCWETKHLGILNNNLETSIVELKAQYDELCTDLENTNQEFDQCREDLTGKLMRTEKQLELIHQSRIWRWTAPFRRLKDKIT